MKEEKDGEERREEERRWKVCEKEVNHHPYARAGEISGDVRTRRAATHRWRQMEQKEGE